MQPKCTYAHWKTTGSHYKSDSQYKSDDARETQAQVHCQQIMSLVQSQQLAEVVAGINSACGGTQDVSKGVWTAGLPKENQQTGGGPPGCTPPPINNIFVKSNWQTGKTFCSHLPLSLRIQLQRPCTPTWQLPHMGNDTTPPLYASAPAGPAWKMLDTSAEDRLSLKTMKSFMAPPQDSFKSPH